NTYISNQKLSFPFKKLNISAQSLNKNSKIQIESDLIDGFIEGNMSLIEIPGNVLNTFNTYLGVSNITKIQSDNHFSFKADIHLPKEFVDIFIPELTVLEISQFNGKYSSLNNSLLLNMDIPKLVYSSIELDSFQLELNGHNTELQLDLLIDEIRYDTLNIQNIGIKQKLNFGELLSEFSISDSLNNPSYLFANVIVIKDDYLKVKFLPEGLILDGKTWKVDTSNYFENNKGLVFAQNAKCTFENQLLQLTIADGYPKISFTNFGIENITNIVTSEKTKKIIRGNINGEIILPNRQKPDYFETTIAISNLSFIDIPVGDLELNFKSDNDDISLSST
ncbi:MAG: hypothetical protein Q8T08_11375, partial [Ignavibacteria bacterium]|nr:hypothetical protein [Ignavibacteria bacterium]